MTNAERFRRGIAISPSCPMCVRDNETPLHVLRDCSRAQEVWRLILPINTQQVFFSLDLQLWIKSNLVFNTVNPHWCVPRNLIFVSVIWLLWKCHNDFTFNDNALSNAPIASSPISQIYQSLLAFIFDILETNLSGLDHMHQSRLWLTIARGRRGLILF
ncbi:hypothetical protein V6N13_108559 [Hibiscus sabdariffa]